MVGDYYLNTKLINSKKKRHLKKLSRNLHIGIKVAIYSGFHKYFINKDEIRKLVKSAKLQKNLINY